MDIRYPATMEPQENGALLVRFVDLDDTFTEGDTLDEALFNAAEVLSAMLGCRLDHDLPVPDPSPAGEGLVLIAPDARTQAALLIRRARGERTCTTPVSWKRCAAGTPTCNPLPRWKG